MTLRPMARRLQLGRARALLPDRAAARQRLGPLPELTAVGRPLSGQPWAVESLSAHIR
jgi:hypothetical protein